MTSVRDEISKNFLYYRKKSGLTQKEIGKLLGVKNTAISNWEKGTNSIDIDTLVIACQIFNISISDMFGAFSNSVQIETKGNEMTLTEKEKRLITAYRNKPEMQSSVDKLLDLDDEVADIKNKLA